MVNSLITTTIAQYGIDRTSLMEVRRKANMLFAKKLNAGRRRMFWQKLVGKQTQLQSLAHLKTQTRQIPARSKTIVNVPLDKITGSEGRIHDFDNAFHPLVDHIRDRWIGIAAARRQRAVLPPVELIQCGDEYYVRDGHHRISVAKAVGQIEIEAQIICQLVLEKCE